MTNQIDQESLVVEKNITNQVHTASFRYTKFGTRTYSPEISDVVEVYDGATKIFKGLVVKVKEYSQGPDGLTYNIDCASSAHKLTARLFSGAFINKTVKEIIEEVVTESASEFTTNNVESNFLIKNIVFSQLPVFDIMKRLADILRYDWYVDESDDIHFFAKFSTPTPYDLTDSSGNYVYKSLVREIDGSQIVNKVIVRGGEYNGAELSGVITVTGNDSNIFSLPYKFANLGIELDTGSGYVAQSIGIDFINDFSGGYNLLYNYNEKSIRFENNLSNGTKIRYTGNPKRRVLSLDIDEASINEYGLKERFITDTSIQDQDTARKRAAAEINTYKDGVEDTKFKTYTAGLEVGMSINLTSTLRNTAEINYVIKRIRFSPLDSNNFGYEVELVTTKKLDLIDILQKLLQPDNAYDEQSIAEVLETDTATITIQELIAVVEPVTDYLTITINEEIEADPLGAGVEPVWVLADYFPTSITDVKRVGLLDRSMKVYNPVSIEIVDSYSESNFNLYSIVGNTVKATGQTFTAKDGVLSSVKFFMGKSGSPTGNAVAKIYAITGTLGTDGKPTGSPLAVSDVLDVSSLSTTLQLVELNFSGINKINLLAMNYCIDLEYSNGNSSNHIRFGIDNSSSSHSGNRFYSLNLSSWTSTISDDNIFYVYEEIEKP